MYDFEWVRVCEGVCKRAVIFVSRGVRWEDNKMASTRESSRVMYSLLYEHACVSMNRFKKEERQNMNMNTQRPPPIPHAKK